MGSFGGSTFNERGEDAVRYPVFDKRAVYTVHRPPGGSRVVFQTSGQNEEKLAVVARGTAAQLNALKGKVGTTATLSWSGGTRSAFLAGITNPHRITTGDYFEFTLELEGA